MPTKIEWAEETWNPVTGCTKISEGCQHCYAERMSKRLAGRFGYPADDPFRVTVHPDRLKQPLHWLRPRRVFICSMGDLFHEDVPVPFIGQILNVIGWSKRHTFLILTKRPQRMFQAMHSYYAATHQDLLINLWLGVTAENQKRADERIPILLQTPAAVRFVSAEPMLGPTNLTDRPWWDWRYTYDFYPPGMVRRPLDWVICGAETGPSARPMDPDWARSVRDQCIEAGVAFFFKRGSDGSRLLDGREWNQYPEVGQ